MIGPQRHAEHVGDHVLLDTLPQQLRREIDEYLIGDLRQGCAHATRGRQLGDQHRRLLDHTVDELCDVHARQCSGRPGAR